MHALIIVAHSDDEVLGAGAQFTQFSRISIIHAVGQAYSKRSAQAQGFTSRKACSVARRKELFRALAVANVKVDYRFLRYRDQEASFHMATISTQLHRLVTRIAPDLILTQAYEGGHQDHDAVAFAVYHALRLLPAAPPIWEMTGYHRDGDTTVRGRFPALGGPATLRVVLGSTEQALKRRMLDCFGSQRDVVAQFPLKEELFRRAPAYDFSQPPTARPLAYELEGWGMPSALWQVLARLAERRLMSGITALPVNFWTALKLHWVMWIRRVHHDRPRLALLLRSVRPLSDIGTDLF